MPGRPRAPSRSPAISTRNTSASSSRGALLTLGCAVTLGGAFGLTGAIVGFAVGQALSAALAAVSLLRFTRRSHEEEADGAGGPRLGALRQGRKFGGKTWGADLLQFLNYRADLFILAAFATRADVGRYSLAVSLTMLAWLLPTAVGQVLLPRTASLDSAFESGEMSREEADRAVARVIRHTVVMQLPTGLTLAVLFLVSIPLVYGSAFHHSIALGFLLLPGVLMLSVGKVASAVVTGRGFPVYSLSTALIIVPVTLLLYWLLIPPLAAVGAAVASTVSYSLWTVLAMHFYRRVTGSSAWAAVIPTRADLREYPGAVSQLVSASRRRLSALRRRRIPQG